MNIVRAVFEDGVFRPLAPPDLPEHCQVEFEPRVVAERTGRLAGGPFESEGTSRHRSALIGLFADEPDVIERVLAAAYENRARPLRVD